MIPCPWAPFRSLMEMLLITLSLTSVMRLSRFLNVLNHMPEIIILTSKVNRPKKKRDSTHITDFIPPTPLNQPKIPHISNKSNHNHNQYESLPDNRYSVHNKGPYFVMVEPVNQVSKHPILIGQILHSSFPGMIKNISKSNFSRVDAECYDGKGANKIVESNKTLINHNLKAFIPNYRVSREGIIRDILLEIEIDDIIRYASRNLKCPVLSARRFLSKKYNGELTPSTTIKIRFDGQEVPDYVYLFYLRIKVQPYTTQHKI